MCRKFRTLDGDPLAKSWISGGCNREVQLPAYAMPAAHQKDLNDSLDNLISTHYDKLLAELQYGQDTIVCRTLAEAARHVDTVSN